MSEGLSVTEVHRARWRRARTGLRLLDPETADFSTGGLVSRMADPRVRLLVIHGDPEAMNIEFDDEFWSWWGRDHTDPVSGKTIDWGREKEPSAYAALRGETDSDGRQWKRYVAILRSGGLEMALGRPAIYTLGETTVFRLGTVVWQVWVALAFYREVTQEFGVKGPWEVTLALLGANNSLLGHFAAGWKQPERWDDELRRCGNPALLFHREIPSERALADAKGMAFSLGGQMEDAWGYTYRRFIARTGPHNGGFDLNNCYFRS